MQSMQLLTVYDTSNIMQLIPSATVNTITFPKINDTRNSRCNFQQYAAICNTYQAMDNRLVAFLLSEHEQ